MERITSRRNPLCRHLKELGASKSYRESCGEFLCDGVKLLEEAVACNAKIKTVLTSSSVPFLLPVGVKVFYAERELIDSLSPLRNSQNVLFSCAFTGKSDLRISHGTYILLDGVQDPGNIGAIMRTADAFCVGSVLMYEGCADPYNPKAIRASMGAVFRQDTRHVNISELSELKKKGIRFIAAALGKDCRKVYDTNYKDAIVVIGSEGHGICEDILELCDEKTTIPIAPESQSLNAAVAAAIIMWEARQK
ncbi:MAG: RNA methyltransferase [Oscillospiraceae bacterium]|nr:RNA methyltransferase [Oscillospiraceae bacterium]